MYNHPSLPGRFFQKKAELEKALKVAWDYKSLPPEQQQLMGPKAPHVVTEAGNQIKELATDLDEIKAAAMSWSRRMTMPSEITPLIEAINNVQKIMMSWTVEQSEALHQPIYKGLYNAVTLAGKLGGGRGSIADKVWGDISGILDKYHRLYSALSKGDESVAYASSGYNHPSLPGRFFQKKAELEKALKVAWTEAKIPGTDYLPGQMIHGTDLFMGQCKGCKKPIGMRSQRRAIQGSGFCKQCKEKGRAYDEPGDEHGHGKPMERLVQRDEGWEDRLEREHEFEELSEEFSRTAGKKSGVSGMAKSIKGEEHPHEACMDKVRRNKIDVDDPEAFCAKAVDEAKGTTHWRGKKKD